MKLTEPAYQEIQENVRVALQEDLGQGDINAQLIPADQMAQATVISRESAILAGLAWFNEVFLQVDSRIIVTWQVADGAKIYPGQTLCTLQGPARGLLSGERCALNFLQTLSATARQTADYVAKVAGSKVMILDTRKTLPGLRQAQKYAVRCGGGHNHRMGLYDAFLIKENHLAAAGSIIAAVSQARAIHPSAPIEVEVETLTQLEQALEAGADIVMLDNFALETLADAVVLAHGRAKLEASGNITAENLYAVAQTGVDYISIGALTKHIQAVDLSMRFTNVA